MPKFFIGCVTILGVPSIKAPKGASGHRILLLPEVSRSINTLKGTPVHWFNHNGHDFNRTVGTIREAWLECSKIVCCGDLINDFDITYPEHELGMSIEIAHGLTYSKSTDDIWVVEQCVFTGASIVKRHEAAYSHYTYLKLYESRAIWRI